MWAATGPLLHFSDTWQLVINTLTTLITFLVVFLIQHSVNRDTAAIQLKLDELLRAVGDARTDLVDLERRPEDEVQRVQQQFRQLRERDAGAGAESSTE